MDLTESIAPKSDQLNAEDLLSGPRTFTIAEVKKGSVEQPVDVHLEEFPGRPFKPSKTVRRIMVAAWGKDSAAYTGHRLTLYRDAAVKFGGMDVGGIRVSHMSHIDKPLTIALTVTRGKRAPYVVKVLTEAAAPQPTSGISQDQLAGINVLLKDLALTSREQALSYYARVTGRQVEATKALTAAEATKVIADLERAKSGQSNQLDPASANDPTLEDA